MITHVDTDEYNKLIDTVKVREAEIQNLKEMLSYTEDRLKRDQEYHEQDHKFWIDHVAVLHKNFWKVFRTLRWYFHLYNILREEGKFSAIDVYEWHKQADSNADRDMDIYNTGDKHEDNGNS